MKNEEDGNNDIGEKESPNEYQDNLSSSSGVGSEENDIRSVYADTSCLLKIVFQVVYHLNIWNHCILFTE